MPAEADSPVISVEALTVERAGREVLSELSFAIRPGDCVALIGPNGAGKSTLMLAMLGLLPAKRGCVRLHCKPLFEFRHRRHIAREIAYVPQQYEGFLGFTTEDMVATGRYAHSTTLAQHSPRDLQIIDQALTACGLNALRQRIMASLSGGERQKVWLATAIAQQSQILFLDEPTTALDPRHQSELVGMLRQLHELGKTLVIICHDLNLPAALKARVLGLRRGQVVFDGDVTEVLDQQQLKNIFETPFACVQTANGRTKIFPDY